MIDFHCNGCGYSKSVDEKLQNRKVIFPKCKKTSRVGPADDVTIPVAAPAKLAESKPTQFKMGLVLALIGFATTVGIAGLWASGYFTGPPDVITESVITESEKLPESTTLGPTQANKDNAILEIESKDLESKSIVGYQRRKLERTKKEFRQVERKLFDMKLRYWSENVAFSGSSDTADELLPSTDEERNYVAFLIEDLELMESQYRLKKASATGNDRKELMEHIELVAVAQEEFRIKFPQKSEK